MICGKLIFYEDAKAVSRGKDSLFNKWWQTAGFLDTKKKSIPSTNIKINSKENLILRPNTIKLLEENRKKSL